MQLITVLIADDHPPFRKTFREILELEENIQVVGEACDGEEAISKTKEHRPDIILMDVKMPKMDGFDATYHIKKHCPDTKIIMLSAHNEPAFIDKAMKLGASAYVTKNKPVSEVVQIIVEVCNKGELQ